MRWRVPLLAAVIGVAICAASFAYGQLDLRFNFFHNPTAAEAQMMGSYQAPLVQRVIDGAIPILTPGTILFVGFKETKVPQGEAVLYFALLAVVAAINALLYGAIGLVVTQMIGMKRS